MIINIDFRKDEGGSGHSQFKINPAFASGYRVKQQRCLSE
jgi:hypothetical protein